MIDNTYTPRAYITPRKSNGIFFEIFYYQSSSLHTNDWPTEPWIVKILLTFSVDFLSTTNFPTIFSWILFVYECLKASYLMSSWHVFLSCLWKIIGASHMQTHLHEKKHQNDWSDKNILFFLHVCMCDTFSQWQYCNNENNNRPLFYVEKIAKEYEKCTVLWQKNCSNATSGPIK